MLLQTSNIKAQDCLEEIDCYIEAAEGSFIESFWSQVEANNPMESCAPNSTGVDFDWHSVELLNKNIYVEDILYLDRSFTGFSGCNFYMAPGSEIRLVGNAVNYVETDENGFPQQGRAHASFNDCTFVGCGGMWKGISLVKGFEGFGARDPYANFTNCDIRDANIAIYIESQYTKCTIDNVGFIDNYIGVQVKNNFDGEVNCYNSSFEKDNGLKVAYANQETVIHEPYIGINTVNSRSPGLLKVFDLNKNLGSEANNFTDLHFGIWINRHTLDISGQSFRGIKNTAIYSSEPTKVIVLKSTFDDCFNGIEVLSPSDNSIIELSRSQSEKNIFRCDEGECNTAITVKGGTEEIRNFASISNEISGYDNGIELIDFNFFGVNFIADNFFDEVHCPISLSQIRGNNARSLISNNTIVNNQKLINEGVFIDYSNRVEVINNTITNTNNSNPRFIGINITNRSYDAFVKENEVSSFGYSALRIQQSGFADYCCNISDGNQLGFSARGTNTLTNVKNTTFENNDIVLVQSAIGTQNNHANRWKGIDTRGHLVNVDLESAISNNRFVTNNATSDPIEGNVRPVSLLPFGDVVNWFINDPAGNSPLCSNSNLVDCSIFDGIPPPNFNIPTGVVPGSCFPFGIDKDGDGICDVLDPDPLDACSPAATDTDGDGICDGIDPDPTNACIPLSNDIDGDGLCDVIDPDPLDPCNPYGSDSDSDGICDDIDIDPTDSTIPFGMIPSPIQVELSISGDPYVSTGYKYSIEQIIESILMPFGIDPYSNLNEWETQFNILDYLIHNPHYITAHPIVLDFYNDSRGSDVWQYVTMYNDINDYTRPSQVQHQAMQQQLLYIDRLNGLLDHYNDRSRDSLIRLDIYSSLVALNSDYNDILSAVNTQRETRRTQLLADLSTLPSNDTWSAHRLAIWRLILAENDYVLTGSDVQQLQTISDLCPLEYGTCVLDARSILVEKDLANRSDFVDNCDLGNIQNRSISKSDRSSIMSIYPNPSTGLFQIQLDTEEPASLSILSAEGKKLQEFILVEQSTEIDMQHLGPGIYIGQLTSGAKSYVQKIIIVD